MWLSTMPCVSSLREGLVDLHQAEVAHHLGPEARVQQVQDRVLDAADVLVHRHPVLRALGHHRLVVLRVAVAHEVPRRIDEGVHRVGLAARAPCRTPGRPRRRGSLVLVQRVAEPSGTQSVGSTTGRSFSGTGTAPCSSQWMIGIGVPQ